MFQRILIAVIALLLGGCTTGTLLPKSHTETPEGFRSFEEARAAVLKIEAMKTRTDELKGLGFDPVEGKNVTLVPYPDIVGRLAPQNGVPFDKLERGIQLCIEAQSACRGYLYHFDRQDRDRKGSFLLDFLNISRTTYVTGWWFDAIVVVSNGTVLFRNYGGQAVTDHIEKQVNPLGPLQPSGEAMPSLLYK